MTIAITVIRLVVWLFLLSQVYQESGIFTAISAALLFAVIELLFYLKKCFSEDVIPTLIELNKELHKMKERMMRQ